MGFESINRARPKASNPSTENGMSTTHPLDPVTHTLEFLQYRPLHLWTAAVDSHLGGSPFSEFYFQL